MLKSNAENVDLYLEFTSNLHEYVSNTNAGNLRYIDLVCTLLLNYLVFSLYTLPNF